MNTNFVTISCITVAGVIEAYQQALSGSPLAATRLPQLDGAWHYVPLGLLIVGGVFWVVGHIPKRGQKEQNVRTASGKPYDHSSIVASTQAPKATSSTTPKNPVTNVPRLTFLQPGGRILTDISAVQLCQMYKDHTTFDANKLAEPYVGTWLVISGSVYNVDIKASGICRISIDGVEGVSLISCHFEQAWQKQVALCKRGNLVNVTGKISTIDAAMVWLEECEFV